jgi:hypothetical protein
MIAIHEEYWRDQKEEEDQGEAVTDFTEGV